MLALLSDPQSAQFAEIDASGPCIRGKINAKNAFGGYVGAASFIYDPKLRSAMIDPRVDPATMIDASNAEQVAALGYERASLRCMLDNNKAAGVPGA